jgi:plasmid stabilization system protein ParE
MAFLVELTAEAEREADAVLGWLLAHNAGDAGIHWFSALEDAMASLSEFPERCALAPEDRVFHLKCDRCCTATSRMFIEFFLG